MKIGEGNPETLDRLPFEGVPFFPEKLDEGVLWISVGGIFEQVHCHTLRALNQVVQHRGGDGRAHRAATPFFSAMWCDDALHIISRAPPTVSQQPPVYMCRLSAES